MELVRPRPLPCTSFSIYHSQLSSEGWAIGVLGFDSGRGLGIFRFTTASRPAVFPIQPPNQWVPGTVSLGVKRPGHEADHSLPSSAEVKIAWSYTSAPQYAFMAWCSVKRAQRKLYFTLLYLTLPNLYLYRLLYVIYSFKEGEVL